MNHNSFYGTYISATRAAIHLGILLVHGHPFGECTGASLRERKIGQNPEINMYQYPSGTSGNTGLVARFPRGNIAPVYK